MKDSKNVIYGLSCLCHPEAGVRYIGLTTRTARQRLTGHFCDARRRGRLPVHRWINKHGRDNITWSILARADSAEQLPALEVKAVAEARAAGADLLNVTDGGEGPNGYVFTEEQRARISASSRGRVHSEETRQRMSDRALEVWAQDEVRRERLREFGGPQLAAVRALAHDALARKMQDPEWAAECSRKRQATLNANLEGRRNIAMAHAVLAEEDVIAIRRRSDEGESRSALGREYGVTPTTISNIARRKTWKHIL